MNKKKCEKCPRVIRTSKLIKNIVTGQLLCSICNNRIGSNKFYDPKPIRRKNQRISDFSITSDEMKVLMLRKDKFQINRLCKSLGSMRGKSKGMKLNEQKEKVNNQIVKKEISKQFLEGLK